LSKNNIIPAVINQAIIAKRMLCNVLKYLSAKYKLMRNANPVGIEYMLNNMIGRTASTPSEEIRKKYPIVVTAGKRTARPANCGYLDLPNNVIATIKLPPIKNLSKNSLYLKIDYSNYFIVWQFHLK